MASKKHSSNLALEAAQDTGKGLGSLVGLTMAAAAGWILYSQLGINHHLPLVDAIPAERGEFVSKAAGRLNYYFDRSGEGRPLVLIHSVNAAASAYEMGPLFSYYRGKRPVFALDLPGYGFSDRSQRIYSPQIFEDAILELITTQIDESVDVVALSLGSEFVARAALSQPAWIHSMVVISPSGFKRSERVNIPLKTMLPSFPDVFYPFLSFPLWGRALFDLIVTRPSIEFFLKKSFTGSVPPGMIEYAYATAHQAGAENAPLNFLSGRLFTRHVRSLIYERIKTPSLAIYDQDGFVSFEALPELLLVNPAWQAVRMVPSHGLPHFERLADTVEVIEGFWRGVR